MYSAAIDQKSVTRPLRSQSPNRVGSSPLGPPISSAAARLSSVGIDLLSSAARTSSIVTSSNGLATCGGFMRGLSLAGGAAAGTSEHNRRTLIVSPHRARGIRATLMTSILFCTRLTKLPGRATSQKVLLYMYSLRVHVLVHVRFAISRRSHRNHDTKVLKPSFPYTTNAGAGCSVARASSSSTSQR
jgi:hypothetical protein